MTDPELWRPNTAADVDRVIADGSLPHESASYEYKAELPVANANKDLAADVAAMATDGGIILFGVAEDKVNVTFTPSPIPLAGVKDRISDIVTSIIRERIDFDVTPLPSATNPGVGYVLVEIPASERAPHMVEVKGDYRYYGRVPGGNTILTESQVARLYERRASLDARVNDVLDQAIGVAPSLPAESRGDLHLVVRPLLADSELGHRMLDNDRHANLAQAVIKARQSLVFVNDWSPHFDAFISGARPVDTLDGFALANNGPTGTDPRQHRYVARLEVCDDGTIRYFHAALAHLHTQGEQTFLLRGPALAQLTAQFLALAGSLYHDTGYRGSLAVGAAIKGAAGAVSAEWYFNKDVVRWGDTMPAVTTNDYRNTIRIPVADMAGPCRLAARLTDRFLRTVRASGTPDPLALQ